MTHPLQELSRVEKEMISWKRANARATCEPRRRPFFLSDKNYSGWDSRGIFSPNFSFFDLNPVNWMKHEEKGNLGNRFEMFCLLFSILFNFCWLDKIPLSNMNCCSFTSHMHIASQGTRKNSIYMTVLFLPDFFFSRFPILFKLFLIFFKKD